MFYQIETPRLSGFGDFPHEISSLVKGGRHAPLHHRGGQRQQIGQRRQGARA